MLHTTHLNIGIGKKIGWSVGTGCKSQTLLYCDNNKSSCRKLHEVYRPQHNLSGGWGKGVPLSWLGVLQCWGRRYPRTGIHPSQDRVPLPPPVRPGYPLERNWDQRPGKEPGTGVSIPPLPDMAGQTKGKHYLSASFGMRALNMGCHSVKNTGIMYASR